jgi:hypothetical protein
LLLVVCLSLAGCARVTHRVSTERVEHWGAYEPGAEYELLMDVFLLRPDSEIEYYTDTGKWRNKPSQRLALVPPGEVPQRAGLYTSPKSIMAYEKDPEGAVQRTYGSGTIVFYDDVVGIVRAGTRLRCVRLDRHLGGSFMTGAGIWHTLYAEILDGGFAGKVADIEDLGRLRKRPWEGHYEREPDPRILLRVHPAASDTSE